MKKSDSYYMEKAIELSSKGMNSNAGGPFGCVIVDKNGKIVGQGYNRVTSTNDPTAHAEVVAIRDACKNLKSFQLDDCTIYTSCEPCPMCLGAIYWARPKKIFYGCSREDAANIGFDDDFIYDEIGVDVKDRQIKTKQLGQKKAIKVFQDWDSKNNKTEY